MFDVEKAWRYHYYIILTFSNGSPSTELLNQIISETDGHIFHIDSSKPLQTSVYIVYPFLWNLEEQKSLLKRFADKNKIKVAIECPKLV